eukprot:GFUD01047023.1.p1 GENE.GFUD01047023.1~~GFUD01047023.1.p1  ORF type:complete len:100 (+),score=17.33 GFUD01047023.1:85-384(+)
MMTDGKDQGNGGNSCPVNQVKNSNTNEGTEISRSRRCGCPECFRNFSVYFPLGLLGFFIFWGAIILKLYLPSKYWDFASENFVDINETADLFNASNYLE